MKTMGVGGSGRGVGEGYFLLFCSRSSLSALTRAETAATLQGAKKVVSNSLGLVDFAFGLVIFVL